MSESTKRSFVKTVSWRIAGSASTFVISFLISKDFSIAGTIAVVQITANTILYFIHERLWNRIKWGKLT